MQETIIECIITFFAVYGFYEIFMHFINAFRLKYAECYTVVPVMGDKCPLECCVRSAVASNERGIIYIVFYSKCEALSKIADMLCREFDNVVVMNADEYIEFVLRR